MKINFESLNENDLTFLFYSYSFLKYKRCIFLIIMPKKIYTNIQIANIKCKSELICLHVQQILQKKGTAT